LNGAVRSRPARRNFFHPTEEHLNPAPETVDDCSPTLGLVKEFITFDEFFDARFNLLGYGLSPTGN
jgi:hypothetical protein